MNVFSNYALDYFFISYFFILDMHFVIFKYKFFNKLTDILNVIKANITHLDLSTYKTRRASFSSKKTNFKVKPIRFYKKPISLKYDEYERSVTLNSDATRYVLEQASAVHKKINYKPKWFYEHQAAQYTKTSLLNIKLKNKRLMRKVVRPYAKTKVKRRLTQLLRGVSVKK